MRKLHRVAAWLVVTSTSVVLSGCGDDGDAGTGAPIGTPVLLRITSEPDGSTLWDWNGGAPIVPAMAPPIALNSTVVFTFDGAVSAAPTTVVLTGVAAGGVGAPPPGPLPLSGTFAIQDAANLPAGNRRRLVFHPTFDATQGSNSCSAGGLPPSATIFADVVAGVVEVAGGPLTNQAQTTFFTLPCGFGAYVDVVAGPPFVVGTSIPLAEPAGAPVDPATIQDDRILVTIGEPLDPSTISGPALVVRDLQTGAVIPGFSTLLPPAPGELPPRTRLAFFAADPFPAGRTLEVVVAGFARDYGGNPVQSSLQNSPGADGVYGTADDGPQKRLLFATIAAPLVQRSVGESFDDVLRQASTSGFVKWDGGGDVVFSDAGQVYGDGSDGAFVAPLGVTNLDTNETVTVGGVPQSRRGVWNFSSLTVPAGATLRIHGPYPAQLRVLGDAVINGSVRADAGAINPAVGGASPAFELGPRIGTLNNGNGIAPTIVDGGRGNAGGGDGGRASHEDLAAAPVGYCPPSVVGLHTYFGETGTGPFVDGIAVTDPLSPYFGGGRGGRSGFIPQSFAGETGGYGGAGGTAATVGDNGIPRVAGTCNPLSPAICPTNLGGNGSPLGLATAAPVTFAFIPPISFLTGGSGGGGGGDKLQTLGVPPAQDDQGGGGGGGGGAFRIASIGGLTLGAAAMLSANGAVGGSGAATQFAGNGGSGSGGQVWLTSIGPSTLPVTAQVQVIGQTRPGGSTTAGCTFQASGGGGQGLVQIEYPSAQGAPLLTPSAGSVVQLVPTAGSGAFFGESTTTFFDLGGFAPDYVSATVASSVGSIAGATLSVVFEGAHALPDGSGPDLSTLKTMEGGQVVTAANISALDGYRFVRVRMTGALPATPGVAPPAVGLPRVESVTITYRTP